MKTIHSVTLGLLVLIVIIVIMFTSTTDNSNMVEALSYDGASVATLAGGCFWCIEAPFHSLPGVIDVISGYAGGTAEDAVYKRVAYGQTDHREAVQVFFDPEQVTYQEVLDLFWRQIDPTDAGGQFADRGFQYTTAIFAHDDKQRQIAESSRNVLSDSGKFTEPIVTEVLPFTTFFPAEEYHQDYYKKAKAHYERYKKASGRSDFIEENWAKEAALQALE